MSIFYYSTFSEELKNIAYGFCKFKKDLTLVSYKRGLVYYVSKAIQAYILLHPQMSKQHYKKLYTALEIYCLQLLSHYENAHEDIESAHNQTRIITQLSRVVVITDAMTRYQLKKVQELSKLDEITRLETVVRNKNVEISKVKTDFAVSKRPLHDELAAAIQENLNLKLQYSNSSSCADETSCVAVQMVKEIPLITVKINADVFKCPISMDIMIDPVIAADGQNYERTNIARWLLNNNKSPMTGEILVHKCLVENRILKQLIQNNN
jgi:hypothetical protein